jgi:hypothetical protein
MGFRRWFPPLVVRSVLLLLILSPVLISTLAAQSPQSADATLLYQQLQNSSASEKSIHLENMILERDRVTMTFTNGLLYLSPRRCRQSSLGCVRRLGKIPGCPTLGILRA